MGAKSSNVITEKQMLPLFQVISDLEKAPGSSGSLQTNFSSFLENRSFSSFHESKSSPKYDEPNIEICSRMNSEISNLNEIVLDDCASVTDEKTKKRHKKRRRLKSEMSSKKDNKSARSKKDHVSKTKSKNLHKNSSISDQSTNDDNKGKKPVGMFTAMALDMYKEDEIDMARHFKNLTDNDITIEKNDNSDKDFPIYEVPTDIVVRSKTESKSKSVKKSKDLEDLIERCSNNSSSKKISRSKIIKKYEHMLSILMEKSQQKDVIMKDKDRCMAKMKRKIKQILGFNNQFADENDYLKRQHEDMKVCIEQYKNYIMSLEDHHNRMSESATANQACPRCSISEASAIKTEKNNIKLNEDVVMLKNVVFRLNVQLSRYQEKLNNVTQSIPKVTSTKDLKDKSADSKENEGVSIPSLPIFPMIHPTDNKKENLDNDIENHDSVNIEQQQTRPPLTRQATEDTYTLDYERCTAWGDVNTHTLAPLLNAYQESLVEKDELIRDYEKEFNRFTTKLKQILIENDNLHEICAKTASELTALQEMNGMAVKERDDLRKENSAMKERSLELESKLKEMHECYEQKVESMSRDYTFIHQEYFRTKTGLATVQGRCQALEDQHKASQFEKTIPIEAHIAKVDECKRLFDDLKNRYELDKSKMSTRISVLQESVELLEKRHLTASNEKHDVEIKLKKNEGVLRKYKRFTVSLRKELTALQTSRDVFKRRATRATNLCRKMALVLDQAAGDDRIQSLKSEAATVQREALKELNAVEERMKKQNINLIKIQENNLAEISKMKDILREKDAMIEAMKQHIDGKRLKKYSGHTDTTRMLPIDLIQTKAELVSLRKGGSLPVKTNLPSSSIIPIKGGYFIQRDKNKNPIENT